MANSHQGHFPNQDTGADAFLGIAPVAQFPFNDYGLYDVGGNVWEWTSDWYRPDYYAKLASAGGVARNPKGPDSPFDPSEPGEKKIEFIAADRFSARTNIVPATWSARVVRAKSAPEPIIWDSAASSHKRGSLKMRRIYPGHDKRIRRTP